MFTYFIQTSSWRLDCRGPELRGRFVKRLWQEFWQDVATMSRVVAVRSGQKLDLF